MGNRKPPLTAKISSVSLSLNGGDPTMQTVSVPEYRGENLFCHVKKSGDLLMITVDETFAPDNKTAAGATQALVVITYRDVHLPPFTVTGITYAGHAINPRVLVSSDLTDAQLVIDDRGPQLSGDAVRLAFVLVQQTSLEEPRYRLEWIQNPIVIDVPSLRTEASVVEPSSDPASAMGPMGLATP